MLFTHGMLHRRIKKILLHSNTVNVNYIALPASFTLMLRIAKRNLPGLFPIMQWDFNSLIRKVTAVQCDLYMSGTIERSHQNVLQWDQGVGNHASGCQMWLAENAL